MLRKELREESYNKSAHRRVLSEALDGRSDGSIERKHQNISAVLIELGYPYIFGYKPLRNYQHLLAEVVASRVASDRIMKAEVEAAVVANAAVPTVTQILARLEDPPVPRKLTYSATREAKRLPRITDFSNYLEKEARNASLGLAGERFVINFERARLIFRGREALADKIEHIPSTMGDGAGFDVRSFEEDGSDRLIEVKTTAFGKQTPFFISRNEVRLSREREDRFYLYRLFRFRQDPRLFMLPGSVERSCNLDPANFQAWVA